MRWSVALGALTLVIGQQAFAKPPPAAAPPSGENACPVGSYSVVNAPDGSAVSVLFDGFSVRKAAMQTGAAAATCALEIPLNLPDGYSLGVYRNFGLAVLTGNNKHFEVVSELRVERFEP